MKNQQRRRRALIGLVFLLTVSILFECWQATAAAAKIGGRPMPDLWPVTLEGFLVVLILVYWDARSDRRKAPLARLLLAGITLVAAGVQALAAPATWLGWVTAAVTPIILTGAVEFTVWLLYGGAVVAEQSTSREGSAPRPSGPNAGSVAEKPSGFPSAGSGSSPELAGSQASSLASATPPLSPTPAAEPVASRPSAEAGSLPDEPRPVTPVATAPTDRDQTVAPLEAKHDEALRRRKDRPVEFAQYIATHGLDHDAVMAMAARRDWPVANGHREAVPV